MRIMRARAFGSAMLLLAAGLSLVAVPVAAQPDYYNFESGQVRPLAMSPDGRLLFAVNTPAGRLEIFDLETLTLIPLSKTKEVNEA